MKITMILVVFLVIFSNCTKKDTPDIKQGKNKLSEFTYIDGARGDIYNYLLLYDENQNLYGIKLNDEILFEVINESEYEITLKVYFPDEEVFISRVLLDDDNRILNIDDIIIPTYNELLDSISGSAILLNGMLIGIPASDYLTSNYKFFTDYLTFFLEFTEMPDFPFSSDEVLRQGAAKWQYTNHQSPIPLPMHDLAFIGTWVGYSAGSFHHPLLFFLNLKGYYTGLKLPKLIGRKDYIINERNLSFDYEFDEDGYVKRMNYSLDPGIIWGTFKFTYSE